MPDLHPVSISPGVILWLLLALAGIITQGRLYKEARLDLEAVYRHIPFRVAEHRIAQAHVFRSQITGTIFAIAFAIGVWSLYVIQNPNTTRVGHTFAIASSVALILIMALLVVISLKDYRLRQFLSIPRKQSPIKTRP